MRPIAWPLPIAAIVMVASFPEEPVQTLMSLVSGTKLGPYEVLDAAGAGGMGEIYKARDTRLDRTVAIKVLPSELAAHPELRQRLEREARAVSSLNHPHICTLYDVGQQDGVDFLVLEYLEGETLASRLTKGPLRLEATLRYAIEMAEALDQAHRHGVVHRDLKPGNIMLTKSGSKLLDFGLARITEVKKTGGDNATALLTRDLTSQGTILGTFQYMSPEQLEGKEVDARSDIFAFGAVLYETLTGRRAFNGASQATLIAAILTADPAPVSGVQSSPQGIPPALDRVLRTCLAKDPDERWQSAGDLARELKWIAEPLPLAESQKPRAARTDSAGALIPWIVAAAAVIAALSVSWLHFREPAPEQRSIRFTIPTEARLPSDVRISPDGTKLAFVGQNVEGKAVLWVRPLDKLYAQALPGTEGAKFPFWSPDSRHIAFFDPYYQGHLKKIDSAGGQPQTVCDAIGGLGGDWAADGTIIFASKNSAIYRVNSNGGTPVQVTTPGTSGGLSHAYPSFLPDGKHFLYLARSDHFASGRRDTRSVFVGSLDSKEAKPLVTTNYGAMFSPGSNSPAKTPGHLLFVRDAALMSQEMDASSFQLRGEAIRITDSLATDVPYNSADFSVSKNGVLAFNSAVYQHELVWLDRAGNRQAPGMPVTKYAHPALASNGRQAVYEGPDATIMDVKLWKLDVDRGEVSLFEAQGNLPVFFPDGSAVAFVCRIGDKLTFCRKASGGAGLTETLWESGDAKFLIDFSPDGKFMSYIDQTRGMELWILPLTGERRPYRFYPSENRQRHGVFSPDGKWIAYTSNETGDYELYVQPFPATGEKWKVSARGGAQPRWRRDGKEMFYRTVDGKMMAVPVKTTGGFEAVVPRMLFQSTADPLYPNLGIPYSVTADGQRFLINVAADDSRASPITVITNWTAGLKR